MSRRSEVESLENRNARLADLVMDHWDQTDGVATCFGIPVDPDLVPDKVVAWLAQIETDYELDLIVSLQNRELSPADVGDFLLTEIGHVAMETALSNEIRKTTGKEAAKASYEAQVAKWQADPDWHAKSNRAKVADILSHPDVPESEKAKWRAFQAILSIASTNAADHTIVTARFEQVDVFNAPSAESFARSFIFDSLDSQIKTGVSQVTQRAIAARLGIVRNTSAVKTGGDVNNIYKRGVGTEKYLDENGKVRERQVFLKPGEDVEIRKGQYIGLSDTNTPVMKIVGEHTYTSNLPENPSDEDMTMYGMTTQWIAGLNDVNMAEMFFPHSVMERGGGHIELTMPDDFNRAQRLSQIFFGAMAGYNGELVDQNDLDRIPYLMQFQNEKVDAVIGDVNPEQMRADYRRQGVLNKDGMLNWDRFAAMIETNRNGLWTSEENFGRNAQNAA